MKYFRKPLFDPIEKLTDNGEPLTEYEALELIISALKTLRKKALHDMERCEFKDGRSAWMVRYSKYYRLRELNKSLKKENENLKAAIVKLSANP